MNVGKLLSEKGSDIIALERGCTVMEVAKLLGERRIGAIRSLKTACCAGLCRKGTWCAVSQSGAAAFWPMMPQR